MCRVANVFTLLAIVTTVAVPSGARGIPLGGGILQPNPDSPLTQDGKWLYGVGPAKNALLRRPLLFDAPWQLVDGTQRFIHIAGLAYSPGDDALVVVDIGAKQIIKLAIDSSHLATLPSMDSTFWEQLSGPLLVGIDGERILIAPRSGGEIRSVGSDGKVRKLPAVPPGGTFASDGGILVTTDPREGDVTIRELTYGIETKILNTRSEAKSKLKFTRTLSALPWTWRPGPVALYRGIAYLADAENGRLTAVSVHSPKVVILPFNEQGGLQPAHILASRDSLFIADLRSGRLHRFPRLVPVEFETRAGDDASAARLLDYLDRERLLPQRVITVPAPSGANGNPMPELQRALQHLGIELSDKQAEALICRRNPEICRNQHLVAASAGAQITVPNLYTESYIDTKRVHLVGDETLEDVVATLIREPGFAAWRSEEQMRRLNPYSTTSEKLLQRTAGDYLVPYERRRLVAAVPPSAAEVLETGKWDTIGIRAVGLEESRSKAQQQLLVPPESWTNAIPVLDKSRRSLYATISFDTTAAGPPDPTYVGVSEGNIDLRHPDIMSIMGILDDPDAIPPAQAPVPAAYGVRPAMPSDHGTMVASLIAAAVAGYPSGRGLVDGGFLLPLADREPKASDEIYKSVVGRGVRVVNLSRLWGLETGDSVPGGLQRVIDDHPQTLFVVAAGNQGSELCQAGFQVWPACWGDKENVLVVAATTATGDLLLPDRDNRKGSNWGPKYVGLAAPGEGFYAAAPDNNYAPVAGTSFSAPLVTSAAALLVRAGYDNAWKIKQRLIATADYMPALESKVRGGLLNVRRALQPFNRVVVLNDNGTEEQLHVDTTQMTLRLPNGDYQTHTRYLRRATRTSNNDYRLVIYRPEDPGSLAVFAHVPPSANWKLRAHNPGQPVRILNISAFKDIVGSCCDMH